MTRDRTAAPHITRAGWQALHAEQEHLWRRRRDVVKHLAAAAAEGDRSENAEYIYGKKQLREIDRRIRFLSRRLDDMVVVDRRPADPDRIYFGAWVRLRDAAGEEVLWRLVGGDEIDPAAGWISIDAPAARALLGHRVDDQVDVRGPDGERQWTVLEISYDAPE